MQLKEATVLVVEDEPVLCEIMGAWFERVAGRVLVAGNGAQALEVLAANRVDAVVSDLRMPVMDGITLLKRIKASVQPQPSVTFITGFSDIEPRDAYNMGAVAVLEKPMDRDELLQIVRRSLMSRAELWRTPMDVEPPVVLRLSFPSLATALQEQKITFGRGGLCIATQGVQEGPIGIQIEFKDDKQQLEGNGAVRWTAPAEGQAGIELLYVAPASREWLAKLVEQEEIAAFIPGSLAGQHTLTAKSA
ncbi:MAG: response regulator [Acidobacteriia bacterium]|nr:response regulator [Terriglobia bacterium]